jgi:hypothetical protein
VDRVAFVISVQPLGGMRPRPAAREPTVPRAEFKSPRPEARPTTPTGRTPCLYQLLEPGYRNLVTGTWLPEPGYRNLGSGNWVPDPRHQNPVSVHVPSPGTRAGVGIRAAVRIAAATGIGADALAPYGTLHAGDGAPSRRPRTAPPTKAKARRPGRRPAHRERAAVRTRTRHPRRRDPPRPAETLPSPPRPARARSTDPDSPGPARPAGTRSNQPGPGGPGTRPSHQPADPAEPTEPPSARPSRPTAPASAPRPDHPQHHPRVSQFDQHPLAKAHPPPPHSRCAQPSFASVPRPHPRPCGSCFRPVPMVARPVDFRSTSRPYAPDLHTRALPSARHPQHPSTRGRTVSHQFLSESLTRLEALRTLCQQALT